ncbi:MAG: hypothetical protein SGPRY_014720, partial [Prymnesium sp.]
MSVGIATVFDGSINYICAMPLWCASASELSRVIPDSRVVIFGQHKSEDCPNAQYIWGKVGEDTYDAAKRYLNRTQVSGGWAYLKMSALLKVGVLALDQFKLILYADMDSDLQPLGPHHPTPFNEKEWTQSIDAFMKSKARFVGSPDHSTPVNTGVWLYKPHAQIYRDALDVLRHGSWNAAQGFNEAGDAHSLGMDPKQLQRLAVGRVNWDKDEASARSQIWPASFKMNHTQFMKENTWFFVGGNIDQGLFWYVIYVKHGLGTWTYDHSTWRIHHFWGPGKPWSFFQEGNARVNYIQRLEQWGRMAAAPDTRCKRYLESQWHRALKRNLTAKDDSPG